MLPQPRTSTYCILVTTGEVTTVIGYPLSSISEFLANGAPCLRERQNACAGRDPPRPDRTWNEAEGKHIQKMDAFRGPFQQVGVPLSRFVSVQRGKPNFETMGT